MPDPINGAEVLVMVNLGTDAVPDYSVLGSQTNVSFKEDYPEIKATAKTDKAERYLPGRPAQSCTLEALYVPGGVELARLKQAARNRQRVKLRRVEQSGVIEECDAIITSRNEQFPDQAPGTVSTDFRIDGGWLPV